MGLFKRLSSSKKAEIFFNYALEIYQTLRAYPVRTLEYHEALLDIISSCQQAISVNDRHGDAHVLLANTFFLLHIDVFPGTSLSYPLIYAASIIQHWSDEPMRQYPWTKNIDNGRRIYDMVSNGLTMTDSIQKYRYEEAMRQYQEEFYKIALSKLFLEDLIKDFSY
jgi:hypothetical protein